MAIDPQFRTVLDRLAATGATPIVRDSVSATRAHYRTLALSRRGPGYVPEFVAAVTDEVIETSNFPVAIRVYSPARERHRVVVYLHGGGWVLGDLDTHDPVCRRVANELGAHVVSVDYRLAPEHPYPSALNDAIAAVTLASERYPGFDLIIAGDSAGANLAAGVALRMHIEGGPALAAQLLIYPATDPTMSHPSYRENADGYFLTRSDMAWFYDQYAPLSLRSEPALDLLGAASVDGLPPAVIATAEFDPLRDEGAAYASKLKSAGVPVRLVPGPGLIHGYFAFLGVVAAADRCSIATLNALNDILR
ncbi:alpha/beta hydrolase [Brevibacterium aurantiacum]|uniref:Acetyl esterase n=1 Tax=Brevibacterium aurantiacum TaxID=273384 RepID=A0A2H1KN21_BREAU|nr:acetyl esterase [Brevibacterium aurantiacum]